MSLWARILVRPLAVGWIVLGWWTMAATCRWWIKDEDGADRGR
jgi:hypothetical protein